MRMDILLDLDSCILVTSPLLDLISPLFVTTLAMIHFVIIARFPFLVTPLVIGQFISIIVLLEQLALVDIINYDLFAYTNDMVSL